MAQVSHELCSTDISLRPGLVSTAAMRQAIASADVGDDMYGEDPTVNLLQEQVAALLGKEAALFMPTTSMSNQAAIKIHTQPGDEVLIGLGAHILLYEGGAPAFVSGVMGAGVLLAAGSDAQKSEWLPRIAR